MVSPQYEFSCVFSDGVTQKKTWDIVHNQMASLQYEFSCVSSDHLT
jgi:hypothetical protein